MSLEELLEIKPEYAGGPVRLRPGMQLPAASGSPMSLHAASTSSGGSAWASDMTEQPMTGSPGSAGTAERRKRNAASGGVCLLESNRFSSSPALSKRRRAAPSPIVLPHDHCSLAAAVCSPSSMTHPGALGPCTPGSPMLDITAMSAGVSDMATAAALVGPPQHMAAAAAAAGAAAGDSSHSGGSGLVTPTAARLAALRCGSAGDSETLLLMQQQHVHHASAALALGDESSPAFAYPRGAAATAARSCLSMSAVAGAPGIPMNLLNGNDGGSGGVGALVGRVASWPVGPLTDGSGSPFSAMASSVANKHHPLGSNGASHAVANLGSEQAGGAYCGVMQQQRQEQHQHHHQLRQHQPHVHHHLQQHVAWNAASVTGSAAQRAQGSAVAAHSGIPCPRVGSPMLTGPGTAGGSGPLLAAMRSNDSAMLQQMFDHIFDEDDGMDAAGLHKLITSDDGGASSHQTTAGLVGDCDASGGTRTTLEQQHQSNATGGKAVADATAASAACIMSIADAAPRSGGGAGLGRSSTWPNAWGAAEMPCSESELAAAPPAATRCASAACGVPAAGGPSPKGWTWGDHHEPAPAALAAHSAPQSGPPSAGGAQPQGVQQPPVMMHALCHQLQQENALLMQRVHTLQTRLATSAGGTAAPLVAAIKPELTAATDGLPRLPPVATRVGMPPPSLMEAAAAAPTSTAAWPEPQALAAASGELLDRCMVDELLPGAL